MKKEKFEEIVEKALAELPHPFKKRIENLAVMVEEAPPKSIYRQTGSSPFSTILGLYHGVPLKQRGFFYGNIPPDVIIIYQKPIENMCHSEEAVKRKVKDVLFHEIGHYFGMTERDLEKIEES
jgi:predicted Zn-dependent protease with MMP-like domain